MESIEGRKLINKMQRELLKNGIIKDTLVADLKELRPFAIAEEDPSLTKVIRLTYEHIEEHGTFNIPIPEEEEVVLEGEDGEELKVELVQDERTEDDFEAKRASLDYLFSIMIDARNKSNRIELLEYRDALMAY